MGEVPIYVVKVGAWCAVSAANIFRHFCLASMNSQWRVTFRRDFSFTSSAIAESLCYFSKTVK